MKAIGFRMVERDFELLREVFLSRALARDQILALGFFGSVARLNLRLAHLVKARFLRRIGFPHPTKGIQSVYLLDSASIDFLAADLDFDRAEVARVARQEPARSFIEHSLMLVDLRIGIRSGADACGVMVVDERHEALCRHELRIASGTKTVKVVLKPDCYVALKSSETVIHSFLEGDRGHCSSLQMRAAFKSYAQYHRGVFQSTYAADSFQVLLVTTAGLRRVANLLRQARDLQGPRFRFATMSDVERLGFMAPIWHESGLSDLVSPLEAPEVSKP